MSDFLSSPIIRTEDALAACASFLAWTGAADAAEAKADYIFSDDAVTDEATLPAQFASISELDEFEFSRSGEGAGIGHFYESGGVITVTFFDFSDTWNATARIAFKDTIAGLIRDFIDELDAGQGLRLQRVTKAPKAEVPELQVLHNNGTKGYIFSIKLELAA